MKKALTLVAFAGISSMAFGQTLFSYGNRQVTKKEFLAAYNKNPTPTPNRQKALQEYLDLYVNYKLKVQAAYDEQLDTLPSFRFESENFKRQLADNFINEEANIKSLVTEAFERSRKDIHVAQVFIELRPNADTAEAYQLIQKAYQQLKEGKPFADVAAQFSNDSATKAAKGDLGFITAFTLSYNFENEIYALKPGQFSAPYKSRLGYHIFKNLAERPAAGRRKVKQILISIPPDATEDTKAQLLARVNEVYEKAKKGEPFDVLVKEYSNDRTSFYNGGLLPEIGVGDYAADFDSHVFALTQNDEVGKPFLTRHGWHIIKLIEKVPVATSLTDPAVEAVLRQQVERDNRLAEAKKALVKKWKSIIGFQEERIDAKWLSQVTDSIAAGGNWQSLPNASPDKVLFSFAKQKVTLENWARYVKAVKQSGAATGKSNSTLYADFQNSTGSDYYRNHLEDYNTALMQQSKEFDEANLLFNAMDKHVWSKAGEDTEGLKNYYESHKAKYVWAPGVSAIAVTATNPKVAAEVAAKLQKEWGNWRDVVNSYGTDVIADSSRYEEAQLPVKAKVETRKGFVSPVEKSNNDDAYTFICITDVYAEASPRSFDEARGIVISDYQQVLEQQWLQELKKKYPVSINQSTWKSVK
jgi:peptidyl-prolyl cis-trans isomerase SurA